LALIELGDDRCCRADVAQLVRRNRLVVGVLLVLLVLLDDPDGEPVVAANEPHVVVAVGRLAAAWELELDPMVANRVVNHLDVVAVLTGQVREDLRVMATIDRAHVRSDDAHADEEERREADEDDCVIASAVLTGEIARDQADEAKGQTADHQADIADGQSDERSS